MKFTATETPNCRILADMDIILRWLRIVTIGMVSLFSLVVITYSTRLLIRGTQMLAAPTPHALPARHKQQGNPQTSPPGAAASKQSPAVPASPQGIQEPLKTQLDLYQEEVGLVQKDLSVLLIVAGLLTGLGGFAAVFTVSNFERRANSILDNEKRNFDDLGANVKRQVVKMKKQVEATTQQLPRIAFLEESLVQILENRLWVAKGKRPFRAWRAFFFDNLSEAEVEEIRTMEVQINALAPLLELSADHEGRKRLSFVYQMLGNFYSRMCWGGTPDDRVLKKVPDQPFLMARSINYFKRATGIDSTNYTAYNDWGYVINYTEKWDEIKKLHQDSLKIFPQQQRAILSIVDILIKQDGKLGEAWDRLKTLPSPAESAGWCAEQADDPYRPETVDLYKAFWASRQIHSESRGDEFLNRCIDHLERAIPLEADPDDRRDMWSRYCWLGTRVPDGFGKPLEERLRQHQDKSLEARYLKVQALGGGPCKPNLPSTPSDESP